MPLPARRRAWTIIACVIALVCAAPRAYADGLFGTREQFSADLAAFTKWDGVVARTEHEMRNAGPPCQTCVAAEWHDFIAELAALPLRERVVRANDVLNRVRYVSAVVNWRDPDHWETPYEFLARGGQCQDYAIAKFMALTASGVPESALRLVVVHDRVTGLDHAVTVVYVDGEAMVLDNQVHEVVPSSRLPRYVPYYSINRTGWWYHLPRTPGERVQVARATN